MKDFIKKILEEQLRESIDIEEFYNISPLLKYLDYKMGAIYGNSNVRTAIAIYYPQRCMIRMFNISF